LDETRNVKSRPVSQSAVGSRDEVFARAELRDAYHELIQRKAPQSAVSAILENFTEVLMAL
jgi:hypothetical protein